MSWTNFTPRKEGLIVWQRDWGTITKCPYCTKKDIKRTTPNQMTCGAKPCQNKNTRRKK